MIDGEEAAENNDYVQMNNADTNRTFSFLQMLREVYNIKDSDYVKWEDTKMKDKMRAFLLTYLFIFL